jgi:hypothetical protein
MPKFQHFTGLSISERVTCIDAVGVNTSRLVGVKGQGQSQRKVIEIPRFIPSSLAGKAQIIPPFYPLKQVDGSSSQKDLRAARALLLGPGPDREEK